jgi:carbonic anhydrase
VNNHSTKGVDDWSRRGFFKASILGAAAGWLAMQTGRATAAPRPVFRQPETPAAAIAELLDGNKRFAAGQLTFIDDDLAAIKKHVVSAQTPFASVLSCADSRVPVELVFDQGIGRLFVARVAGNIASPDMIASLEYGVAVPGTKAILVLGHANCGAVKATVGRTAAPGQISGLYSFIQPAVEKAPPHDLNAAIKANARIQASLLREASPVIASAVHEGRLKVAAAYYDLASGRVSILN